ncbi:phosphotransferase family protein [Protofrankia symbiont of Coriaria ruscifolia]|uniref:phosphotransferase family protein n=1 Tax=Protofrankia symbiont of Coriaria ruscifolia TaxID=1306542 RepID=UPI0010410AA6|nr:phosphotransferase family protein [Protofrankia symbiont of Coriaria ruscifolia]
MAVPIQRDPARTRAALAGWLATRPAAAGGQVVWEVGEPTVPGDRGFSTEILLVDAYRTGDDGHRAHHPLVVRLAADRYRVYPWDRFEVECRVMATLDRDPSVAVPVVYGYEPDPAVLGAPFVVLGRVDGAVPADLPSYHRAGWVTQLPAHRRAALWDAALTAMAAVHRVEPGQAGLADVDQPEYGQVGAGQQLRSYEANLEHFGVDPAADPGVLGAALTWLHEHPPAEPHPPRLLWGDARLGNIIFTGDEVGAILDWEMVTLGQPEADLAWFLHLDRHLSEGIGAPRLAGLPDRAATLERYAGLLGRPLADLDYHTVSAALRFALIATRVTRLVGEHAVLPPGTDLPLARNATRLLGRVLEEVPAAAGVHRQAAPAGQVDRSAGPALPGSAAPLAKGTR